jgi:hypothetical protein
MVAAECENANAALPQCRSAAHSNDGMTAFWGGILQSRSKNNLIHEIAVFLRPCGSKRPRSSARRGFI